MTFRTHGKFALTLREKDNRFSFALGLAYGRGHLEVAYLILGMDEEAKFQEVGSLRDPIIHMITRKSAPGVHLLHQATGRSFAEHLGEALAGKCFDSVHKELYFKLKCTLS